MSNSLTIDEKSSSLALWRLQVQLGVMDSSSAQSGQGKSSSTSSVLENKRPNVDPQDNQDKEKNGTSAGCRLTQEMLDFYYQKSKESRRYKRQYEEASCRVYGTIPFGVDPQKFRERMAEIPKKRSSTVWGYVIGLVFHYVTRTNIDLIAANPAISKLPYRGIIEKGWI